MIQDMDQQTGWKQLVLLLRVCYRASFQAVPKKVRVPPIDRHAQLQAKQGRVDIGGYAEKLEPHPHVAVALGLSKVKPRAFRPS